MTEPVARALSVSLLVGTVVGLRLIEIYVVHRREENDG